MQHGNVFSLVCLSVCNALTFESLDPENSFLVCKYLEQVRISRSSVKVKVNVKVKVARSQLSQRNRAMRDINS